MSAAPEISTFVGVGQHTTDFRPLTQKIVPSATKPIYYEARSLAVEGNEPPPWLLGWVLNDLAQHGYFTARALQPDIVLVLEWQTIDRDVTHVGRPLQPLDAATHRIVPYWATRMQPGSPGVNTENPPFCIVSAFDHAATIESPPRAVKLWEKHLWFVYINPVRRPSVNIGAPVVKDYFTTPIPKSTDPATNP